MRKFLSLIATSLLTLAVITIPFSMSLGEAEITLLNFSDSPTNIRYGSDVHVVAQITGHDDWENCILIEPNLLEKRIPLLEGLDTATQAILLSDDAPEAELTVSCSSVVVGTSAKTVWYVDGQEFTLKGNETKTIKTLWGTYKFDAFGKHEKISD